MTAMFNGVASILADAFGGIVLDKTTSRAVKSIFREGPTLINDSEGKAVWVASPTWTVRRDLVPHVKRGSRIEAYNGKTYKVLSVHPSGSPAADAVVICQLEEVGA